MGGNTSPHHNKFMNNIANDLITSKYWETYSYVVRLQKNVKHKEKC